MENKIKLEDMTLAQIRRLKDDIIDEIFFAINQTVHDYDVGEIYLEANCDYIMDDYESKAFFAIISKSNSAKKMRTERIYTNKETGVSYKIVISLQTNAYGRDFYWTVSCTKRGKGKRKWQEMYDNPYWGRQFQGMTHLEAHETVKKIICAEVPWEEIYECQKQILLELQKPCVTVPIKIGQDD